MNNVLTDFDNKLMNVDNLKWLPWIGENYSKTKIIILGESQYEDGDEWQEGNIDATRILIDKRFAGDKAIIYSNVEKVLLSIDKPSQEQGNFLWKSVVYLNLVPRLMISRNERPKDKDFDKGWELFFNIIEVIEPKPEICIVLGKSSCGRLGYYLNNNVTSWDRIIPEFYEKDKIINLSNGDHKLKLIFINHPSGSYGFGYKKWAELISNNQPDLRKLLIKTENE